jgi:hypothetical protein
MPPAKLISARLLMSNDPALEAREHAEHAEHAVHEHDPFISRVSLSIAVLAVLAAVAGSLETVESGKAITSASDAVLAQERATDAWNEYQADSLKRHMYDIAASSGGAHRNEYLQDEKQQQTAQDTVRSVALKEEGDRDRQSTMSAVHEDRHHWLTGATTLLEIGIALSTVAIITKRRQFWLGSMGLGIVGGVLFIAAYVLPK